MKTTYRSTVVMLAFAVLVPGCMAAHAADADVSRCRDLRDDASRLACYDRVFGDPHALPDSAADERRAEAKKSFSFTATVTGLEKRRDGKFVATFDNGQVWEQTELNSRANVRVGDSVAVRRAALGSYLLSTREGIGTRVKRLR
jgi:hypothetical protein